MDFLNDFNSNVNSVLRPVTDNAWVWNALKLFLFLYGSLAAPTLPPQAAKFMTNTYARIAFMAAIIWISDRDVSSAILVAAVWFITLEYVLKNGMSQIVQTGIISPEFASVLTGGTGPSIKPDAVKAAEAQALQISVSTAAAAPPTSLSAVPGNMMQTSTQGGATYKQTPQATLSTGAQDALSPVPSGVPETKPALTVPAQTSGVPAAHVPDELHSLAVSAV